MLEKLLTTEDCANCKICCSFDSYDLWETPVITKEMASKIIQDFKPDQTFIKRDDHFLLKMDKESQADLYYCSLLDRETGCILGKDKPFDCRIWPFRVMALNDVKVLTVSPVCPVVNSKSLEDIHNVATRIADKIFEECDEHPEFVKPYLQGYPIVIVEDKKYTNRLIK